MVSFFVIIVKENRIEIMIELISNLRELNRGNNNKTWLFLPIVLALLINAISPAGEINFLF
jgi:hypothetical protein